MISSKYVCFNLLSLGQLTQNYWKRGQDKDTYNELQNLSNRIHGTAKLFKSWIKEKYMNGIKQNQSTTNGRECR